MKLPKLAILLCASPILAQSSEEELKSLLAAWSKIAPTITAPVTFVTEIPTRLMNVVQANKHSDPPPTSLMLAIFTGVPQTVLAQLVDPSARASIASEFAAGNTPDWYNELPSGVKSYVQSINEAIKTGGNDYTPPVPDATGAAGGQADSGDGNEATGGDDDESGGSRVEGLWGGSMRMAGISIVIVGLLVLVVL
ncbi:hypothetical protein EJ05DRAFT_501978 [Pseudovirgaria hyperparasitica]|uniref:Uncharacterized protein n=1 Tax=Pseudovirgaria hyperparasitica TaxID=470096 RepID=A0A6A6W1Q7_9PEZI|nr:uncharacterized protein EJ05DRAFT_501978 [Pseudovirgaria hyperparasitica]KAF2756473.1 hypothetical protein EJ05DRAFT_501978 [Pseudovirgaria hyperparasitica]